MRKLLFGLVIVFVLFGPRHVQARRAIPDDNLAYPVLISLDTGSQGSGFFLDTGTRIYLVTATHVLFNEASGKLNGSKAVLLSYSKDPTEKEKNIFELDLPALLASGNIRKHSSQDVSVVYIGDNVISATGSVSTWRPVAGVNAKSAAPSGILDVAIKNIKRFDDVLIGNTIFVFGYPTSLGIKEIPQIDPMRPLLRSGIIAGTNPDRKTIIIDCPSYPGNSGGPVLEVDTDGLNEHRFLIIGVVIQFVPFVETWVNMTQNYRNLTVSNSGYAVVTPMDPVLELITSP